jgi:hypothetical protein
MYSPHRNPTELYYESHNERDTLLRQEALNKRLVRRPLATLSTMLVVIVVFVGLASIVVGPGRAMDYIGTYLLSGVWIIGAYEPPKKRSGTN